MNKGKQILENQISLNLREDKTLEIYVGDSLAAEISDGRLDMEFVKEILEGLDYEINESSFTIRPLHSDEQKYTYRQSTQIEGQTGSIGYLRGDFGSGKEFFSSWFDHRRDLKTDKFKSELDEVINALRSEEYGLLKSRTDMTQYAAKYPDSAFQGNYATEYGFRADTEKYSFLIRCNPARKASVVFPCPLEALITVTMFSQIELITSFSKLGRLIGNPLTISAGVAFFPS